MRQFIHQSSTVIIMVSEVSSVLLVMGACLAIIGACRIYYKWSNGQPDIDREVIVWIGGIIFLVLVQVLVKVTF
jgi:hypothetical protein